MLFWSLISFPLFFFVVVVSIVVVFLFVVVVDVIVPFFICCCCFFSTTRATWKVENGEKKTSSLPLCLSFPRCFARFFFFLPEDRRRSVFSRSTAFH